jgi:hypothetical protein
MTRGPPVQEMREPSEGGLKHPSSRNATVAKTHCLIIVQGVDIGETHREENDLFENEIGSSPPASIRTAAQFIHLFPISKIDSLAFVLITCL